ncbi:carboxylate/amino acid/amine transporter [Calidithermus terrae]|uniref:Carboxylate/amino acid/amine transporter n=1 Tax=Calidithermus terrae TaxID=1408545 RepID=A0A399EFD1_9DEIN|nr:EamA family transporter [Calidithermus terrae]RIH81859.1 carboxylate/amino acid/amine transporter [Calidithermus terrae]
MDSRTLLAIALTLLPWASAFAGIRAGLEAYSPGHLTLLRFLVASLTLLVYALAVRMPLPRRQDWPGIFAVSFLGITVYHTALNFGQVTVLAGPAALLIACGPVFTALLSRYLLKEEISPWGWTGIAIAFTGVALIAFGKPGGFELQPGALLILLAALATSLYFVLQKPFYRRYTALQFTAYSIWAGTLPMLVFLPGLAQEVAAAPAPATLAVVYLGVLPGGLSYITWSYALSRAPASRVTSFLYVNPLIATLIAFVWLGEVPALLSMVGGAVALAGVVVVNTLGRVKSAEAPRLKAEGSR